MTTISKRRAKALFDELASTLVRTEELVLEILDSRAWEPLGYANLVDAWDDLLGDFFVSSRRLRVRLAAHFAADHGAEVRRVLEGSRVKGMPHGGWSFGIHWILEAGIDPEQIFEDAQIRAAWTPDRILDGRLAKALAEDDDTFFAPIVEYDTDPETGRKIRIACDDGTNPPAGYGYWLDPANKQRFEQEREDRRSRGRYRRRAHDADLPERQYRITLEFTAEEIERFKRVAEASGRDMKSEAKRAVEFHFDRLESELKLSV